MKLILGGAASGKSAFAENLAIRIAKEKEAGLIYLATMEAEDVESLTRVDCHRRQREGKGFQTLEIPYDLEDASEEVSSSVILLECLSNLLANQIFDPKARVYDRARLLQALFALDDRAEELIVVSNIIHEDGVDYPAETIHYLEELGALNQALARRSSLVVELVCGLANVLKEN